MADTAARERTGPLLRQFRQFFGHSFTTIRYTRWGPRTAPRRAVLVHGFMQNGREFDPLAAALAAAGWCVYCPDLPGHGWSGRRVERADYDYLLYAATVSTMVAVAGRSVDLVGNSMGAVITMLLGAAPGAPLRSLVLNDGSVQWADAAIRRFAAATPATDRFATEEDAGEAAKSLLTERGPLDAAEWRRVLAYSLFQADGQWRARYDPRLKWSMDALQRQQPAHWRHWERIAVPTLLIRGEVSTMLTTETAQRMIERQPRAELLTMPGVGHSPWLRSPDQIGPVVDWLQRH